MFFPLCLLAATAAASVAFIVAVLRKAPEAYEDEHGLQIIRDDVFRPVQARSTRVCTSRHETIVKHLLHGTKATVQTAKSSAAKPKKKYQFSQPLPGFVAKPEPTHHIPFFSHKAQFSPK